MVAIEISDTLLKEEKNIIEDLIKQHIITQNHH